LALDKARLVEAMGEESVEHDKPLSHPWQNVEPQPPSEQVTPMPNPVYDDKQPAPPERSIFGMAAELKNLIRKNRIDRSKQRDKR